MLGAGYAFLKNAHVRIDFISSRFSAAAQLDRHPRHRRLPGAAVPAADQDVWPLFENAWTAARCRRTPAG
jgi:hypothetical protein